MLRSLEITADDIHLATCFLKDFLGMSFRMSHGSYYGGWHGYYSDENFSLDLMHNPHDVGEGRGMEYHRPEFPGVDIMLWCYVNETGFDFLEARLKGHPRIKLFITGFEKNWPHPFWGHDLQA